MPLRCTYQHGARTLQLAYLEMSAALSQRSNVTSQGVQTRSSRTETVWTWVLVHAGSGQLGSVVCQSFAGQICILLLFLFSLPKVFIRTRGNSRLYLIQSSFGILASPFQSHHASSQNSWTEKNRHSPHPNSLHGSFETRSLNPRRLTLEVCRRLWQHSKYLTNLAAGELAQQTTATKPWYRRSNKKRLIYLETASKKSTAHAGAGFKDLRLMRNWVAQHDTCDPRLTFSCQNWPGILVHSLLGWRGRKCRSLGACAGKPWGQRIWFPISSVFPNSVFEVVSKFHSLKALAQSCAG